MDLFLPVTDEAKFHPNFRQTLAPSAVGVREILMEWAAGFPDRDGKFVHEFQTTYNSCFWELYLFAVLKHLRIALDFSHPSPDFVAAGIPLAIEATIASHAYDDVPEWEKTLEGIAHNNVGAAYIQSIIRLSNAFLGKSAAFEHRYAGLPHMTDRAYVVAISNYGTQDFNMLGRLRWLKPEHAKLVWARAEGTPWKLICWRFGIARATMHPHWRYGLSLIAYRLNGRKVPAKRSHRFSAVMADGL